MQQRTLFSFDLGATNWRIYRAIYEGDGDDLVLHSDPRPSPLSSFNERRLPAALLFSPDGQTIEAIGEVAQAALDQEKVRSRVREHFKPCIGSHLLTNPLPHQTRFTHVEALDFTTSILSILLEQLRQEKWHSGEFDDRVQFIFSHPIHWQDLDQGQVLDDFRTAIQSCFPQAVHSQIKFVSEPEGALRSLRHFGLFREKHRRIMMLDVGGSTTDIVIGEVDPEFRSLKIKGRYGNPIGGLLFDAEVANHLADDLKMPASAMAQDAAMLMSLRATAKRLKESLSRQILQRGLENPIAQRMCTLVSQSGEFYRGMVALDRARFEGLTKHLQIQFEELVSDALNGSALQEDDVDVIALVGGGSQLFTHVEYLRERFGPEKVVLGEDPAEAVACGASLMLQPIVSSGIQPTDTSGDLREESAATASRAWQLRSPDDGQSIPLLTPGTLGRIPENDYPLTSEKVSRVHAELTFIEGGMTVKDLGSTNGTFINNERVAIGEVASLVEGDRVRFGDRTFILERLEGIRRE